MVAKLNLVNSVKMSMLHLVWCPPILLSWSGIYRSFHLLEKKMTVGKTDETCIEIFISYLGFPRSPNAWWTVSHESPEKLWDGHWGLFMIPTISHWTCCLKRLHWWSPIIMTIKSLPDAYLEVSHIMGGILFIWYIFRSPRICHFHWSDHSKCLCCRNGQASAPICTNPIVQAAANIFYSWLQIQITVCAGQPLLERVLGQFVSKRWGG